MWSSWCPETWTQRKPVDTPDKARWRRRRRRWTPGAARTTPRAGGRRAWGWCAAPAWRRARRRARRPRTRGARPGGPWAAPRSPWRRASRSRAPSAPGGRSPRGRGRAGRSRMAGWPAGRAAAAGARAPAPAAVSVAGFIWLVNGLVDFFYFLYWKILLLCGISSSYNVLPCNLNGWSINILFLLYILT